MKKLFFIIPMLCALLLAGCAAKEKITETKPAAQKQIEALQQPFESTMHIKYDTIDATASFIKGEDGICQITLSAPESLKGAIITIKEGAVGLSYLGMSLQVNPDSVPGAAAIKLFIDALSKSLSGQGVELSYQEGVLLAQGSLEGGGFVLRVDKKTGNLVSLSIPSEGLEIEMENFKFLS